MKKNLMKIAPKLSKREVFLIHYALAYHGGKRDDLGVDPKFPEWLLFDTAEILKSLIEEESIRLKRRRDWRYEFRVQEEYLLKEVTDLKDKLQKYLDGVNEAAPELLNSGA